jgi:hypothetical protein
MPKLKSPAFPAGGGTAGCDLRKGPTGAGAPRPFDDTRTGAAQAIRPHYGGGSIVNLMRSIGDACAAAPLPYPPLDCLDGDELARARNLVLLVVDGLGADYLRKTPGGALLQSLTRCAITSVFPSTTASAITSFLTGLAPQQHALTGWHMYFEELGEIAAVLPLKPRDPASPPWRPRSVGQRIFHQEPFFKALGRASFALAPAAIVRSEFNTRHTAGAQRVGYVSMRHLFEQLEEVVRLPGRSKYIYAYLPDLDALAHDFGIASAQAALCLAALDAAVGHFLERVRGTGTLLLVSADHGFIDAPAQRLIDLADHPELVAMLERPLCGERRVAYCYVRPECRTDFIAAAGERLGHAATVRASADLIAEGWFGSGAPDCRLPRRIGDVVLSMKEDWTIYDHLPGEKRHPMIGVHGGTSAQEMYVPLIVAAA